MEFPTIDKFAKEVAENALDEITYEGKTIREWAEIIVKQQPCEDSISKEKMLKVIERMEKLEEDLYRTEGAESSFATLCLCVEWIKEALE